MLCPGGGAPRSWSAGLVKHLVSRCECSYRVCVYVTVMGENNAVELRENLETPSNSKGFSFLLRVCLKVFEGTFSGLVRFLFFDYHFRFRIFETHMCDGKLRILLDAPGTWYVAPLFVLL